MSEDKQPLSAFPHPDDGGAWGYRSIHGMTLRDYFAAKALNAVLTQGNSGITACHIPQAAARWAREAYLIADAMMKAREA